MKYNTFINSYPYYVYESNVTVENNDFTQSNLEIAAVTEVFISKNIFLNNSLLGLSELVSSSQGNSTVRLNLFKNNSCALSISSSKGISITANNFIKNKKNVLLSKECLMRDIPSFVSYKQVWMNNYWDDWSHSGSYRIKGSWTISLKFLWMSIPLFKLHWKEYDPTPAQKPYDIPGMN